MKPNMRMLALKKKKHASSTKIGRYLFGRKKVTPHIANLPSGSVQQSKNRTISIV